MKIVHLADTHLGYRSFAGKLDPERNLNQRECDVYEVWHRAIARTIELKPSLVIHAGDLFDSSRPSPRAVAEALDGFKALRDAGLPVVVIAGNHSTPRFRSGGSIFEVLERFDVETVWREPRTIEIDSIAVHAVPHEPDGDQLLADIRTLEPSAAAAANILVLHAGLEGVKQGYHEVNEISLDPTELAAVSYDYVALGHLHRQQVPQSNAAYSGSLERLDFSDLEGEKGILEIDLSVAAGGNGFLVQHGLPVRPMFDFPIDCHEASPAEVVDKLDSAIAGLALEGAVVRVGFERIARDVYHALDVNAIDRLLEPCLHVVRQVGKSGLGGATGDDASDEDLSFLKFAEREMPKGVESDAVVKLALRYLGEAESDELEAAEA
jgi:DNA repair exonuclease SbcCD nuclease subunit